MAKFKIGDVVDLSHYGEGYTEITVIGVADGVYRFHYGIGNKETCVNSVKASDIFGKLVIPKINLKGIYGNTRTS